MPSIPSVFTGESKRMRSFIPLAAVEIKIEHKTHVCLGISNALMRISDALCNKDEYSGVPIFACHELYVIFSFPQERYQHSLMRQYKLIVVYFLQ